MSSNEVIDIKTMNLVLYHHSKEQSYCCNSLDRINNRRMLAGKFKLCFVVYGSDSGYETSNIKMKNIAEMRVAIISLQQM